MFIKNKYYFHYFNLCSSRKNLDRRKSKEVYYESHHITPKSLGGSDEPDNLVLLTAREHFIAHMLLIKFTKDEYYYKMLCAYMFMSNRDENVRINSKIYQSLRQDYSIYMSLRMKGKNHYNFGKKISIETKDKMSKAKIGKKHPKYKGNYRTPYGTFITSLEAEQNIPMLPFITIHKWCKDADRVINSKSYGHSNYLKSIGTKEDIIGKTFRDLGFWFNEL